MATTTQQTTLLVCFAVVLTLTSTATLVAAGCGRVSLSHRLRIPGCLPTTIHSVGCRGTCNSYMRISPTNHLEVERYCLCCQEVGYLERKQRVHCPGLSPSYRDVTYRIPKRCSCTQCRSVASISRVQTLEDLRQDRSPAVLVIP